MLSPLKTSSHSNLEAIVVHWSWLRSDNILRARALSIEMVRKMTLSRAREVMNTEVDQAIIFSWWKTHWQDNPSEAEDLYNTFLKRLKIFNDSGEIPWGISYPSDIQGLNHWDIRIGKKTIAIHIEDMSVDTEDNVEKSMEIIRDITKDWEYSQIYLLPLSSDFHIKRIGQSFKRHCPKDLHITISPFSAEGALKKRGGRYERYGELKEASVSIEKVKEIILCTASRFKLGRKAIRKLTGKRVQG